MIGEKMKELRLAAGISAEQIAEFLNVSPATVYRYENGDISKMPAKFIKPLAEFLHTSPASLMGWPDPDPSNVFKPDEARLLAAYRAADDRAKADALRMLEEHPAIKEGSSSVQTA